jgi:hypothetical protein
MEYSQEQRDKFKSFQAKYLRMKLDIAAHAHEQVIARMQLTNPETYKTHIVQSQRDLRTTLLRHMYLVYDVLRGTRTMESVMNLIQLHKDQKSMAGFQYKYKEGMFTELMIQYEVNTEVNYPGTESI